MNLEINQMLGNDNIIDYGNGYTAGSIKAVNDFKKNKRDNNFNSCENEYKRGFKDGYNYTKYTQNQKTFEDDLTKLLRQGLMG